MEEAEAKHRARRTGLDGRRRCRARLAAGGRFTDSRRKLSSSSPVKTLIDAGVVVITVGGGGIPVIDEGDQASMPGLPR